MDVYEELIEVIVKMQKKKSGCGLGGSSELIEVIVKVQKSQGRSSGVGSWSGWGGGGSEVGGSG